ncbi:MAG: GNAT family N-acetyltransferase [Proteobacteria bacterium]|nr:GNAT family N-acetyltransferase [Desulfobacteraceae bacterium]MBU0733316.1 GNAT family N-acetyltransferase [Pseudomonadota bacterium]MBL7101821.1 GNAT family N-acetyltransferase [Desulfobacteraceae bacterium]MBL7171313.1 GNAT family N-acetyltransferase [Desulfobacteraceae bacterium]MBU0990006.1 GNAT family N-acetyltransferase [Pseudomonadota bacterium]
MKTPHSWKKTSAKAEFVMREAVVSDVDFIRTLSLKAFRKYGPYEDILPTWFLSGIGLTVVALMGKRPAGYAMLGKVEGEDSSHRVSEMLAIAVEPSARNQGLGDLLMGEMIRRAEELFVETLILYTGLDNLPGQALFEKHGFVPAGIREVFYPGGQNALMMRKDIG